MGSRNPERDPPSLADHLKLVEWVADFPAWGIRAQCHRCINGTTLHPRRLLGRPNPPRRIGDLKARLVCRECGSRNFALKPEFLARRS